MASPYEVAIHLTVSGNAQSGLAGLSQQMNKLNEGAEKLHKAFALIFVGGEMKRWGEDALGYVKKTLDAAGELSHELAKIKTLGITPQQFAQAKAAAFAAPGQVPGITSLDALRIYGQTYSPLGHENALKMLVPLATFVQAVGATTGNYKTAEDKIYSMVRAGDLMGKFMNSMTHQVDIEKLQHFLDLGARVIQATHGRVGADQWFALAQQGGPALSNMSDQGLLTMAMITQAMGGGRAGTALSSLFTQFQGGIMTKWRAQKLMEIGILDKNAVQEVTPGGHIMWRKGSEPGTTPFARAMAEDPLKAIGILQTAMATHGYPTIEKQVPLLFELFQRQTSIREIHDLLRNLPQLQQERGRITEGLGASASANLRNTEDYEQAIHNLDAAFRELMMQTGFPAVQALIPFLNNLGKAVLSLANVVTAHPDATKNLLAIATGFGVAMTVLGTLAISAGIAALLGGGTIIVGLTALTGALAGLAAVNWSVISPGIQWLIEKLNALHGAIIALEVTAFEKVIGWMRSFGDAISELWNKIKSLNPFSHTSYEGGGVGGGGGIINTSYGGAAGGGLGRHFGSGVGGSGRALSAGEHAQYASMIRQYGGEQADNLLKIYGTEGASSYYGDYVHGKPTSFGPFQSHFPGMANKMLAAGIDVRDKSTVPAQIEWMRKYGERTGGYSSDIWHGLRKHGGSLRAAPHMPPPAKGGETHVHNNIHLDGKIIARSTSKHLANHAQYATSVGRADGRGTFMGPGFEQFA